MFYTTLKMEYSVYLLVFLLGLNNSKSNALKSSLTFVIDDTASMSDDIAQVKLNADAIFDTVVNSNISQIEDFVLVTFNDPDVSLRTVTKDRQTFKNALRRIKVDGGGLCPEMAMHGIELALQKSRDASLLYVFTDASAEDYEIMDKVKDLSQKKRIQVVFVLTGDCGNRYSETYLAYHKLAKATQGQVFHMERKDIGKILDYVKNTIKDRKHVIASKTYPAGYGHKFDVNVDGDTKELVIAVSGLTPSVGVTDSAGTRMPADDIARLAEVAVVKVRGVKPGVYTVEVGSKSETNVVVSGTTTVHFQHGFSVLEPADITETATRPVPEEKSYVSIKLDTDGGKVELQSIQMLDLEDHVVLEQPLKLLNDTEQFYTTTAPVSPPNFSFRIAIKGYHKESKTFITRISLTRIEPQKPIKETVLEKAPVISVDKNEIEAQYNEHLQMKCKVSGYPKPDIIWESDDHTMELSHTDSVVELPYAYISILNVKNVKKSSVYTCKAVNKLGTDHKSINAEMKQFFHVLDEPKDTSIEYKASGQLFCRVDALPPATIFWYKDRRPLVADANVALSDDNSTLTIRSMQPGTAGNYVCEARNDLESKVMPFTVSIPSVGPVVTIDGEDKVEAKYNDHLQLKCRVSGYPKPDVIWESDVHTAVPSDIETVVEPYGFLSILHVKDLSKSALYTCKAINEVGTDSKSISVELKSFFKILDVSKDISIEYKASGELRCLVKALPPATIFWYKDRRPLVADANVALSDDNSTLTIRSMQPGTAGNYICEARNEFHRRLLRYIVSIAGVEKPKINKNQYAITALRHSSANITCEFIRGKPTPSITWYYYRPSSESAGEHLPLGAFVRLAESAPTLAIADVEPEHGGLYRCVAANVGGTDEHDVEFTVEYPPELTAAVPARTAARAGSAVSLACPAAGAPPPAFRWRRGDRALPPRHTLFRDGTLRFTASLEDSGNYECEARNEHGAVRVHVQVEVHEPANIEIPKRSRVSATVGEALALPCRADGAPAPSIEWLFHSADATVAPRTYPPSDPSGSLHINRIQPAQDGFYTCVASNVGGSKNITYTVSVLAPPSIRYSTLHFSAVAGDRQLRVPCDAIGNPAPSVTWTKGGFDLPLDSPWYMVDSEHALLLKDVDALAAGSYTCRAENSLGAAAQAFQVDVQPYPTPGTPEATIWLEEGKPALITCSVSHRRTDRLLWFKDHRMISDEELSFKNVSRSDAGLYTCRVSSFTARTGSTRVVVGWAPQFLVEDNTDIEFDVGNIAVMGCDATGEPKPEVQWFHDDMPLPVSSSTHEVEMISPRDQGRYTCVVANKFGAIQREYVISTHECVLDMKKDFNGNEPLMLTRFLDVKQVDTTDGYVHIRSGDRVTLGCPAEFNKIAQRLIEVECLNDKQFSYGGRRYSYSELKCRQRINPKIRRTAQKCADGRSEIMSVGYEMPGRFIEVYQVCLDLATRNTIYTKHKVGLSVSDVMPEYNINWFGVGQPSIDMDLMYACRSQNREISLMLGRTFSGFEDGCCFARRQLVGARDVAPGLRAATYSRLNVAPQWSTCHSENWEEVEARVRALARAARRDLRVWSGAAGALGIYSVGGAPVPEYFWKVVEDPTRDAALGIVQVNVPGLRQREASLHQLCRDVCFETDWMRSSLWRVLERGYTYCCRVEELADALGLRGDFTGRRRLLTSAAHLAESSALHLA